MSGNGGSLAAIVMMIVAPICPLVVQLGISRQRTENTRTRRRRALIEHPDLISALEKLGAYNNRIPMTNVSPSTASLYIVTPLSPGQMLTGLFSFKYR